MAEYLEFTIGDDREKLENYIGDNAEIAEYGNHLRLEVNDGGTLENILFDVSENLSHSVQIVALNVAATVRNIGIRGECPTVSLTFLLAGSAPEGETITWENIFYDGRREGGMPEGHGYAGAFWSGGDNHGTIEINNCFMAGLGNNASYMEAGRENGTTLWENCYFRDSAPAMYRTGLPGSVVKDCVGVVNDPDGTRGRYPASDSQFCRVWWNRGNNVPQDPAPRIDNLHVYMNPDDVQPSKPIRHQGHSDYLPHTVIDKLVINEEWIDAHDDVNDALTYDSDEGEFEFNTVETGPDISVLGEGVPNTPEMAASGERGIPQDPFAPAPDGGVTGIQTDSDNGEDNDSENGQDDSEDSNGEEEVNEYLYEKLAQDTVTDLPYEIAIEHQEEGVVQYEVWFEGNFEVGEFQYNADLVDEDENAVVGRLGPTRGIDNIYFDGRITQIEIDNPELVDIYIADAQERTVLETIQPGPWDPNDDESDESDEEPPENGSGDDSSDEDESQAPDYGDARVIDLADDVKLVIE